MCARVGGCVAASGRRRGAACSVQSYLLVWNSPRREGVLPAGDKRGNLSEMDSPRPRNSGSGDIGYGFVDLERPGV